MLGFVSTAGVALVCLGFAPAQAMSQASAQAAAPVTIDALTWLEGSWARRTARGDVIERWTRVSEHTMEGLAFSVVDGARRISEHLRIEQMGSDVFYIAKPKENPLPTAFALRGADGGRFVFENPDHDFPQRNIYSRRAADSLLVRIEGDTNGAPRGIDFRFGRMAESRDSER
jgi:hypothetical protein